MLIIREKQMEVFRQSALTAFENRAIDHLKEFWTDYCSTVDDKHLRTLVRESVSEGNSHTVTSEKGIVQLLELKLFLERDFLFNEKRPWIPRLLRETTFNESQKLSILTQKVKFRRPDPVKQPGEKDND